VAVQPGGEPDREAQTRFGLSVSKIVKMLRSLRTATITLGGQQIEVPSRVPDEGQQRLLDDLKGGH
jgi:transposase